MSLDDFLDAEGISEEVALRAMKRVIAKSSFETPAAQTSRDDGSNKRDTLRSGPKGRVPKGGAR